MAQQYSRIAGTMSRPLAVRMSRHKSLFRAVMQHISAAAAAARH